MDPIEPDEILEPDDPIPRTKKIERNKIKRFVKRKLATFGNYLLDKVEKQLKEHSDAKQNRFN